MAPELYSFVLVLIIIISLNYTLLFQSEKNLQSVAWITHNLEPPSHILTRAEYESSLNRYLRLKLQPSQPLRDSRGQFASKDPLESPQSSSDLIKHIEKTFTSMKHLPAEYSWMRVLSIPTTGYHSFNNTASDIVGNFRHEVLDTRPAECRSIYYDASTFPLTSVIIIFHNEARSTLLRTIHSILERTPDSLLKEIILVDDASTFEWLKEPLGDYVPHLKKVKLVRLVEREGLIRARVRGASEAQGEVLVFLDAHTEVNQQWLEPLLQRIVENPHSLVIPAMDPIGYATFDYMMTSEWYHGGFRWNLLFKYKKFPPQLRGRITDPIPSPVMVGCAHAIRKDYFLQTGAYDTDMDIWGGENLEHSFRLWMCGGRVEVIPCSKVGHVFKPRLPYDFTGDARKIIQRNLIRTAEVWMDEYKDVFYATQTSVSHVDMDSLNQRKLLRKRLKCKTFRWYLDTVFPDMPVPPRNVTDFGDVTSKANSNCLQVDQLSDSLITTSCEEQQWDQTGFYIDDQGCFHNGRFIIAAQEDHGIILRSNCQSVSGDAPEWLYTDQKQIRNNKLNMCIQPVAEAVLFKPCKNIQEQKWEFRYKFDFSKTWDLAQLYRNSTYKPKEARFFGKLKNVGSRKCLNIYDNTEYRMVTCHKLHKYEQVIQLDKNGKLSFKTLCIQASPNKDIMMVECKDKHENMWKYDEKYKSLSLRNQNKCMMFHPNKSNKVLLVECRTGDKYQKWIID